MSANPGHNKEHQLARTYETDKVYLSGDTLMQQLYEDEVSSLVDSLYQGVNSALLAYGEYCEGPHCGFWGGGGVRGSWWCCVFWLLDVGVEFSC
jgi:hypothetical protein